MIKKEYEGIISEHEFEGKSALFLSSIKAPISDELSYTRFKNVTIRYWITDEKTSKYNTKELFYKIISGIAEVEFNCVYSKYSGYLWTDENLKIGGHDLMEELYDNAGKYLFLEIEYEEVK